MIATIINSLAIIIGTIIGLIIKRKIKPDFSNVIMEVLGLAILTLGITQAVSNLMKEDAEPILFIIALVIGRTVGELLNIEGLIQNLAQKLKNVVMINDDKFVDGIITATLLYCVGAMTIIGSIQSGIEKNHTILLAKSMIDGISSIFLAAIYGVSIAYSAVFVLLIQGSLTFFASSAANYISDDIIREMSIVGGIILIAIGLKLLNLKDMKIANYIPALFIPIIYYLIIGLI